MNIDRDRLVTLATQNVTDTLTFALEHDPINHRALVVYDTDNELTTILTDAYRRALPDAEYIDFNTVSKQTIINAFNDLSPRDLVVLIQSTDFRLNEFRIRIQLFQRKLKVIDHQHLYRNTPDSWETYINAIAYDPAWYRTVGPKLKKYLEEAKTLSVFGTDTLLTVTGGLEVPKLNIGDYSQLENIGGTFPIGEVFTEARDLSSMNGSIMVYAFANSDFSMGMHEPFEVNIVDGYITSWSDTAPISFGEIIAQIKTNERALVREIGFGLNRAITREKSLNDITAFERNLGMHFSIGEKHTVYKKQGITPDKTRFHVDIFPVVSKAIVDETTVFENGAYVV